LNNIHNQDGQATGLYFVQGCVGTRQSKSHQGKKNDTEHWMNTLVEKLDNKVLGVQGTPAIMPRWQRFEVALGGDSNWDVDVPTFPTMSCTHYTKEGAPGRVVRVGTQ